MSRDRYRASRFFKLALVASQLALASDSTVELTRTTPCETELKFAVSQVSVDCSVPSTTSEQAARSSVRVEAWCSQLTIGVLM